MTHDQLQKLTQMIQDRYEFIAAQIQSVDYQPEPAQLERWKRLGLVPEYVTPQSFVASMPQDLALLRNAFIIGRVADAIEQGTTFEEAMRLAVTLPLRKPDLEAIQIAEHQTAMYLRDNASDLATKVGQLAIKKRNDTIRQMAVDFHSQKLKATVLDREAKELAGEPIPDKLVTSWQQFKSELHHTLEDKGRDLDRVAYYEITDAQKQGQAHRLIEQNPDQLVYKRPLETACPQCKYAYLLEDGKTPKIFRLSDMMDFGSNIGRKPHPTKGGKVVPGGRPDGADTMKPVCGLQHPYCACMGPYPVSGYEPWLTEKQQKIVKAWKAEKLKPS